MGIFEAFFLGMVQGFTEFLPVSSSGHIALFQHLFGNSGETTNLLFSVLLHLGTLFSVVFVYRKTVAELIVEFFKCIKDIFTGKFTFKIDKWSFNRRMLLMFVLTTSLLLFMIIPIGGYSLKDMAEVFNDGSYMIVIGFGFLLTSAVLLTAYFVNQRGAHSKKRPLHDNATPKDALLIGAAQLVAATFPGVSRSGSTMSTGLICGLEREYMVKYSFILSVPAIVAAVLSEGKECFDAGAKLDVIPTVIGFIASVVFGILAIKLIQWIVKKDLYNIFGYYCGVLGILVVAMCIIEKIAGVSNILKLF